ncbi:MAG TPA: hypothetical protein VLI04_23305 [Nocardioidaceae bacterium]|nr:hypothetical protein [Nocardioidaceae bacterium]
MSSSTWSKWRVVLLLLIMMLGGTAGYVYAEARPPQYQATASVIVGELFLGAPTEDSIKASAALAASYSDLVRREPVLGRVAENQRLGDWRKLQDEVFARPSDKNPLLIQIQVTGSSPIAAQRLAEGLAERLIQLTSTTSDTFGQKFARRELTRLESEMSRTETRIDLAYARRDVATSITVVQRIDAAVAALRDTMKGLQEDRLLLLQMSGASAGDVTIMEEAYARPSPYRPDQLALTVAGIVVGMMLGLGLFHFIDVGRRNREFTRGLRPGLDGIGMPPPPPDPWVMSRPVREPVRPERAKQ